MRPGCVLGATPRQLDHTRDASATCRRPSACNVRGMSDNSFDARATLRVGDRELEIFRLDALQSALRRRPAAVLPQDPAREPAPHRGNGSVTRRGHRGAGDAGTRRPSPSKEIAFTPAPRAAAGLHRRARASSTSPRCATRWPTSAATRDRSTRSCPSSSSSTTRSRSTSSARRAAFAHQRRAGVRAQPGALRVPALGPGRVRELPRRAAGHRHRPPGQPRVPRRASSSSTSEAGVAYPDTLVGTDSHTTMINGLGVLGWGVGGIEAEAAMLGQPMSMLIPQVVGFKLHGELPEGATATDLVLTVTEMLRKKGVVGKFVEFYGPGVSAPAARRPRDDRQHGARVRLDVRDLPGRRRDAALPASSPAGRRSRSTSSRPTPRSRASGTTRTPRSRRTPTRSSSTSATVEPIARRPEAPAGPRPAAATRQRTFREALADYVAEERAATPRSEAIAETFPASDPPAPGARQRRPDGRSRAAGGRRPRARSPSGRRRRSP